MNKKLMIMLIALMTLAGVGQAETIEGPCSLKYSKEGTPGKTVKIGKIVKGQCQFTLEDFFGKMAIIANGEFVNTGSIGMNFSYFVAFFDKDKNFLGCSGYSQEGKSRVLGPGKKITSPGCIIRLPDFCREKIASFQVTFYESEFTQPAIVK